MNFWQFIDAHRLYFAFLFLSGCLTIIRTADAFGSRK